MKKIFPYLLVLIFIMLIIPAISLKSGQTPKIAQPSGDKPSPSQTGSANAHALKDELEYKILNHKTGEVMNLTPLEYISGVVAAEMPIEFHSEALSAQAVAAHTYALRQIASELENPTPEFEGAFLTTDYKKNQAFISDEDLRIKWGNSYAMNKKKLDEAVLAVIDKVIVVDNKPIIAAFHSLCNGTTESALNVWGQDVSYLQPVKSEGDNLSPKFSQKMVLTPSEVKSALTTLRPDFDPPQDASTWFSNFELTPSQTVGSVKVGDFSFSGKEIREALGLKSASFDVDFLDGNFTFSTRGYGHGVGMSQYGADFLARQGKTYDAILSHYYKGVEIVSIENLQNTIDNE